VSQESLERFFGIGDKNYSPEGKVIKDKSKDLKTHNKTPYVGKKSKPVSKAEMRTVEQITEEYGEIPDTSIRTQSPQNGRTSPSGLTTLNETIKLKFGSKTVISKKTSNPDIVETHGIRHMRYAIPSGLLHNPQRWKNKFYRDLKALEDKKREKAEKLAKTDKIKVSDSVIKNVNCYNLPNEETTHMYFDLNGVGTTHHYTDKTVFLKNPSKSKKIPLSYLKKPPATYMGFKVNKIYRSSKFFENIVVCVFKVAGATKKEEN